MANSVDNRVVQMEFENASFEKGIAQSLKSLEELHNKLDNGIDVKGLDELSSKVDKISFASTIDQVDQLESRCNGLVSILKATVEELGGLGGVAVKALGGSAIAQMVSGGIKRTENIEAARFQLEGLGVAWDDVRESINYAVLDTAYGADEAARAASQFVASGVQLGDEMSTSLRSISGVAAMTNSTYEDTARIFTTIAGNGRIMTMQLNQLAMRGLNAAAIMAQQWGLTEEEVRQLVHEGVIDFRTFSDAMDEAFGEHAKKANETFSGAFANMKAALSRIGADFIGPWREMERQVFLGVKDMLNNIKSGLNEYVDITDAAYGKGLGIFGDEMKSRWNAQFEGLVVDDHVQASIVSSFESFVTKFGERVQNAFHNIAESGVLSEFVKSFTWALTGIFDLATSISTALTDIFEHLVMGFPTDFLKNLLDPIGNIAMSLSNFLYPLLERIPGIIDNVTAAIDNLLNAGLSYIQPILVGLIEGLTGSSEGLFEFFTKGEIRLQDLSERFLEWSRSLGATDEQASALRTTLSGIASAVRGFFGGVVTVAGGWLKNIVGLVQQLWPLVSAMGNFLTAILEPAIKLIGEAFGKIGEKISGLLGINIGTDAPFGLDPVVIQGAADAVNRLAEKIREVFQDVTLDNLGDKILEITGGFINLNDITSTLSSGWGALSGIFGEMADRAKGLLSGDMKFEDTFLGQMASAFSGGLPQFGDIGGFLNELLGVKKAYADTGDVTDSIDGVSSSMSNLGDTMVETADKGVEATDKLTGGVFEVLQKNLGTLGENIGNFIANFTSNDLITGISMVLTGFLTGAVFKFISNLKEIPGAIKDILSPFASFATSIAGFGATLRTFLDNVGTSLSEFAKAANTVAKAEVIKSVVIGIIGIAGAIFLLSLIPSDKIAQSLGLLAAAVVAVGLAVVAVEVMFKTMDKAFKDMDTKKIAAYSATLLSFAAVLLSLGVALLTIAGAVAILSLLDPAKAWSSFGIVALFIGEFIGMAAVLGKIGPAATTLLSMAAMVLSMAVAIGVLTASILVLALVPWPILVDGLIKLGVELVVLIGVLSAVSRIVAKFSPEMLGAAAVIAALGIAILPFTIAVMALSQLDFGSLIKGVVGLGVGLALFAAAIAVISVFANRSVVAMLATVPIILAMAAAVLALAGALAIIGTIPDVGPPIVALILGIVAMTAAIAVLASVADVLVAALPTLIGMGAALVGLSVSLIAFALAMKIVSTIPDVGPALLVMVAAVAALTVACVILAAVSPGLLTAGVALALIGAAFLMAGAGALMFAGAMVVLGTIGPATAVMISTALQTMAQGAGESLKILSVKTAEAIVLFVQTLSQGAPQIAQGAAEIGKASAQGFAQAAPDFGMAGVQAVLAFAQGIGANIGAIASAGVMIVSGFLLGVAQSLGAVIDSAAKLAIAFINGVGDAIRNNASLLYDAVTNVMSTIFGLVESLLADAIESIVGKNPISDAIRENADGLLSAAQEASDRVNAGLNANNDKNVQDQKSMMSNIVETIRNGGQEMGEAATDAGGEIPEGVAEGAAQNAGDLDLAGLISGEVDLSALSDLGLGGGTDLTQGFMSGAEEGMSQIAPLFQGKSEEAVQAAGSVDSSGAGNSVGSNFGAGIAAGMDAWIGPIAEKAAQMVREAKDAANSEQAAASPSKDMIESGGWFGEGFYIGMGKWIVPISKRAENMVAQAKRPIIEFANSTSSIFEALDFSDDPVITPVLDLSQVEAGAGGIQSILDSNANLSFSRLSPQFGGSGNGGYYYYNNEQTNYGITLDWRAGQDANDVLNDLSAAIKARNMTGGRGKHGR